MALRSAIDVLRALKKRCEVRFVSDSQYLSAGMTEWMPSWKARGWKRKGGAIKNLDLWRELDHELGRHNLRAAWVRGHTGHPENEYADFLATRAAREQTESSGLVSSGFEDWLESFREKGQYLGYMEFTSPRERYPEV
jgi:ribonuclease HI